jgi:tetratricopeptide (TPR) repeat protein
MPAYVPTVAELEAALKQLHNPEALRHSPLAALDLVHERVDALQRVTRHAQTQLPWIYGYELAALLRDRIERLHTPAAETHGEPTPRAATRPQLYAHILRLRYLDDRSWREVAQTVGLAAGHIQNKLKRPALQRLLGDLLDQRNTDPSTHLTSPPPGSEGAIWNGMLAAESDKPAPRAYLTNLPAPGEFIGRHAEIEHVMAKLRRRRMPIIEISGVGGVGKSALAKHIGWRALDERLVDGVIWLCAKDRALPIAGARATDSNAGLHSLTDLFETTARVLGASQVPMEPDARRRQALDILSSGRFPNGILMIVDNYETLQPEEQERIVSFLFEELPYPCQALLTSRHEEHRVIVQTLILPTKIQLERMSHEDAVACLDYFLSLHSPPLLTSLDVKEQIIALSAQIPLAMLWLLGQLRYAARSQQETIEEIWRQHGNAGALLSYIFDYSYALLDAQPGARAVLHALTAFAEPVAFEPLAAVAALPPADVEHALLLLQRLSLITRDQEAGRPRYGLLDLARSYVASHISDAWRHELLLRAGSYYATQALPDDRANITPLLEWALKEQQELALGLFDSLTTTRFVESDTQVQDCASYGAAIVAAARALGDDRRADWYEIFALCWPLVLRHDVLAARMTLERLLERAQRNGWHDNRALACSTLGLLFNDLGTAAASAGHDPGAFFETAAAFLRRAAALWEDLGRRDWLAVVMGRLGTVARQLGDYDRALDYYTWTAALYEALGNRVGHASVLGRRGYTLLQRYRTQGQGDPQEIERLLVEALQLNERLGNRWGIAANSLRYAEFLELQHQPERAHAYAVRAHALFEIIPEPHRARQAVHLVTRLQPLYRASDE